MARSFNGVTDKIDTSLTGIKFDSPSLLSGAVWANPISAGRIICNSHTDTDHNGFQIAISGSTWFADVGNGTISRPDSVGSNVTFNTWSHIAFVYDGANVILYLNGSVMAAGTSALTGSVGTPSDAVAMGYNPDYNGDYFNGRIADAAIWNAALTPTQIALLANGTRPPIVNSANLIGYWPLDGYASPEPDLSGNANNGTLTGTSQVLGPPIVSRAMGS